jgi:hypothetical protein
LINRIGTTGESLLTNHHVQIVSGVKYINTVMVAPIQAF